MGDKTARTFTPDTKLRYVPIRSPVQPVSPLGSLVPNEHSNYLLNKCSWEKGGGSPLCSNFTVFQEYLLKCLKKCSIAMNASSLLKKERNLTAFLSIVVLKRRTEKELATVGTSRSRCVAQTPDQTAESCHLTATRFSAGWGSRSQSLHQSLHLCNNATSYLTTRLWVPSSRMPEVPLKVEQVF